MNIRTYENKKINEKLYFKEMNSGLKVYFIPKVGYKKQYAIFSTEYGSIDNRFIPIDENQEIEVPEGIAHFLEHKLFEEPKNNIFDEFSKLGADVNAYTNFDQTAYLFSSTEDFYKNLSLLIKFVQNPYFTDENIEKEKGIIAQEINMYKDDPDWKVFFNCLNAMYKEHPVRMDIAGTIESIGKVNKDLLYKCYNTFYNPSNMILFIIGDLSFGRILSTIEDSERKNYIKINEIQRIITKEPKEINKKIIEEEMITSAPIFYIGIKEQQTKDNGKLRLKKSIITNIILDMLFSSSSKFYNDYYESGIINSNFGAYYTGKKDYGYSMILGESKDPKKVYEKVIELFKKNSQEILLEKDFNRIMRKNIGEFLMGLNSIEFIANNFLSLYYDDVLILDYLDLLETIDYKDLLLRFDEHFIEDNMVLSIINPIR